MKHLITYKLTLLSLLVLSSRQISTANSADAQAENVINREFGISGADFSNCIYQRYYFIKRLAPCITVLRQLNPLLTLKKNGPIAKKIFSMHRASNGQNPAIAAAVKQMQNRQSLTPLLNLWQSFASYQSINDSSYTQEFVWEIFLVTRSLLRELVTHERTGETEAAETPELAPTVLCEQVAAHAEKLKAVLPDKVKNLTPKEYRVPSPSDAKELAHEIDAEPEIHMDQILHRFYLLQRLNPSRELLQTCCSYPLPKEIFNFRRDGDDLILNDAFRFTSPAVKKCIEQMDDGKNMQPLCKLLDEFGSYVSVHNEAYSREVLLLICTVYRNILVQGMQQGTRPKSGVLHGVLHMYSGASSFSIEEILDLINVFAEEIPTFLGKFEFYSNLNWRAWIKRYWWVPPLVVLGGALRVYYIHRKYQGRPPGGWLGYFGAGGQPDPGNGGNPPPPPIGPNTSFASMHSHMSNLMHPGSPYPPPMRPTSPYPPPPYGDAGGHEVDLGWDERGEEGYEPLPPRTYHHRDRYYGPERRYPPHHHHGRRHSRESHLSAQWPEEMQRPYPRRRPVNPDYEHGGLPPRHPGHRQGDRNRPNYRGHDRNIAMPRARRRAAPAAHETTAGNPPLNSRNQTSMELRELMRLERVPSPAQSEMCPGMAYYAPRERQRIARSEAPSDSWSERTEPPTEMDPPAAPAAVADIHAWHDSIEEAQEEHDPDSAVFGPQADSRIRSDEE